MVWQGEVLSTSQPSQFCQGRQQFNLQVASIQDVALQAQPERHIHCEASLRKRKWIARVSLCVGSSSHTQDDVPSRCSVQSIMRQVEFPEIAFVPMEELHDILRGLDSVLEKFQNLDIDLDALQAAKMHLTPMDVKLFPEKLTSRSTNWREVGLRLSVFQYLSSHLPQRSAWTSSKFLLSMAILIGVFPASRTPSRCTMAAAQASSELVTVPAFDVVIVVEPMRGCLIVVIATGKK
eukprot:CAMPEP_0206629948 /NCGR_PEP_ID=MMETSP0325_2-20121206/67309_1 /ASSEMBLY_ACC=CAM_ASM_000347 /TAXON_ID=2866 /ORGANISM="Crypthecodinium cohnii, Strain Seligo" /LENGTH=235 /DNA_ID=CAMNT_0054154769 /DNA_START=113 /DNA_END=818 /DNA_ORIENTATION=+